MIECQTLQEAFAVPNLMHIEAGYPIKAYQFGDSLPSNLLPPNNPDVPSELEQLDTRVGVLETAVPTGGLQHQALCKNSSTDRLTDWHTVVHPEDLAAVATSGAYGHLSGTPSLAAVATTGAYGSLSGLPTLGTAASTASSTYALAGQGGADPWTYVRLTSGFWTSSAAGVNVPNFNFTPAASKNYEIEGQFYCRTSSAAIGGRPGCTWPTNNIDGIATIWLTSGAGTTVIQNGNVNTSVLSPVGGFPNATQSWPGQMQASLITSASTSGNFQVVLATESSTIFVGIMPGSFMRYRTYT